MNWINQRIKGVSNVLSKTLTFTKDIAWAVGTTVLIVGYPLALSILDDRYIRKKGFA